MIFKLSDFKHWPINRARSRGKVKGDYFKFNNADTSYVL